MNPDKNIKDILKKSGVDALLITNVANISWLTSFYGFSTLEREAFVLLTKNKKLVITDGRYAEAAGKIKGFDLAGRTTTRSVSQILEELSQKYKLTKIGFEEENLSFLEHKVLSRKIKGVKLVSTGKYLAHLRILKNENEIQAIKSACKITDAAFTHILRYLKPGVTEKEIALELEFFIKKKGGELSFPSIVAFGANSSVPHHSTGNKRLVLKDKFILLDFGVKKDQYCSDMSRTVFIGKVDEKLIKMYQTVLDSQQKAIEKIAVGKRAGEIDQVAREYIIGQGYPSIPHSLGHGVGLEVHESPTLAPKSRDLLKPGMVFTIEPGIYIPGLGGVRIEDDILLTKSGPQILTRSSKAIIEI